MDEDDLEDPRRRC